MAKICLCLTAKTLQRNLEILEKYRKFADLAELRVDCLDPDERLLIRNFPAMAGLPVILTIRRTIDGGYYFGGEGSRVNLLARGLAYADADTRRNFAYVDIEEDLNVPSLEEAARTFGTRIIRSYHNLQGTDENIEVKIQSMLHAGDELVKVALTANSTSDVFRLFQAGKKFPQQEKILISMGRYGMFSRILAERFGSYLSYANTLLEPEAACAAPGQLDVQQLAELFRFRSITKATKVYGVLGHPLKASSSPFFFNTVFGIEGMDAVYVSFPADSLEVFMGMTRELGVSGLSVTVPYKEDVIPYLAVQSPLVQTIGACNTLCRAPQGWLGSNTDVMGFSDSLLDFTGRVDLKRQRITLIGAGGAAKAVAIELHRLGAKVLVLNRTVARARELALPYKFAWGGLDSRGIEMMDKYCDIIIQSTSAGMEGNNLAQPGDSAENVQSEPLMTDPVEMYSFKGSEDVMDLVYNPERTPFLIRAAKAGCRVMNGYDMLIRQARYQYTQFMGKDFPVQVMTRVQFDRSQDGAIRRSGNRAADERSGRKSGS